MVHPECHPADVL
jgi:hypothetical protein